jgi:hypothetical protein
MVCAQCQHPNPDSARFCNACAAPLDVCPACGHVNPPANRAKDEFLAIRSHECERRYRK